MDTRGVVIGPDIRYGGRLKGSPAYWISHSFDKILMYAIYWDRVAVLDDRILAESVLRDDITPLVEAGATFTHLIDFDPDAMVRLAENFGFPVVPPGSYLYESWSMAPFELCAELSKDVAVHWTVGGSVNDAAEDLDMPWVKRAAGARSRQESERERDRAIRVALVNSLPAPRPGTSVDRVLRLRERRRAELLAFRAALDGFFNEMEQSADRVLGLVRAKEKLELSLIDLHRVMDEGKIAHAAATIKAYLSLGNLSAINIIMASAGAAVSGPLGISPAWGALGGLGLNASLTFASGFRKPVVLPAELKDFAYLYHVEKMDL
jgi:hypothetical protein